MMAIHHVNKQISSTFALSDIDLAVSPGEVVSLLGPNGSGKTSIMRLLNGIYTPDSGRVLIGESDFLSAPEAARQTIGVATDRLLAYPWMTVEEYLEFCGQLYRVDQDTRQQRTTPLLARFGLFNSSRMLIRQLSNGMKQKLNLIRATLHAPRVLLLDEPTLGLDPMASLALSEYIRELASGGTSILIATHDLLFTTTISDRVLFLVGGRLQTSLDLSGAKAEFWIDVSSQAQNLPMVQYQVSEAGLGDAVHVSILSPGVFRFSYSALHQDPFHHRVIELIFNGGFNVCGFSSSTISLIEHAYRSALQSGQNSGEGA